MRTAADREDQLRGIFQAELEERVPELNRLLLHLEASTDEDSAETLDALFREAHNLKGAARAVDLPALEHLAHALESSLGEARGAGTRPTGAWFDSVYHLVDSLKPAYEEALGSGGAT